MSKYQELSTKASDTIHLFNSLRQKTMNSLVTRLSKDWGCPEENISFEFDRPKYFKRNEMISLDFIMFVTITVSANKPLNFRIPGFSAIALKDFKPESNIIIKYHDKNYDLTKADESEDSLSNAIFQNIEESIEKGGWITDIIGDMPPNIAIEKRND